MSVKEVIDIQIFCFLNWKWSFLFSVFCFLKAKNLKNLRINFEEEGKGGDGGEETCFCFCFSSMELNHFIRLVYQHLLLQTYPFTRP